ncbi:MAG: hypothetical protein ABF289_06560 [Clostridiales bacterium]
MSIQYMRRGQVKGKRKVWHSNGKLKLIGESEFGNYISYKEWNEDGVLINELNQADEETINHIKILGKQYETKFGSKD